MSRRDSTCARLREIAAGLAAQRRREREEQRTARAARRRERRRDAARELREARIAATGGRRYVRGSGAAARALLARLLVRPRTVAEVTAVAAGLGIAGTALERAARELGVRRGRGPRDHLGRFAPARWWLPAGSPVSGSNGASCAEI